MRKIKYLDILGTLPELHEQRKKGFTDSISTGWSHMDNNFKLLKGQLNIVSGFPSSGKSEWVENIACHLAVNENWNILVYSPENHPATKHTAGLAEKIAGKQMRELYNREPMTERELDKAIYQVSENFTIISADDDAYSFEELMQNVENSPQKIDMILIDPWNELDSHRPANRTETDYIGMCLRDARRLARKLNISFWIVCHPAKPAQKNKAGLYDPPDMYSLAGSAHWYNKADNAFIVHREDLNSTLCKVMVKKVKNRHYGRPGEVEFDFQPASGRFEQPKGQR